MINGIYSGAAAMDMLGQQLQVISDNLAHANTTGHRRQVAGVSQRFDPSKPSLNRDLGPEITDVEHNFRAGRIEITNRPLDVALQGDGFLVFDKNGEEHFTRNGRLFRDAETGNLVDHEGFPLLGTNGPISIEQNAGDLDVTIAADGTVAVAGNEVGQIRIQSFADNQQLLVEGESGFGRGQAVERESTATIAQHMLEQSNVAPVSELIGLIINSRQHQAIERATKTMSETLGEYIRS